MPAAVAGAHFTTYFSPGTLKALPACTLLIPAASMLLRRSGGNPPPIKGGERFLWRRVMIDSGGKESVYTVNVLKLSLAGVAAGLISGSF